MTKIQGGRIFVVDVHTPEQRRYNMSCIRNKNTKPEEMVRKHFFSQGFRYRKNDARLPGKPDIVLHKYKTVIFVNGCFWHGHIGCKYFVWPKNNAKFWKEKISKNVQRDLRNHQILMNQGWYVIDVWECQLEKDARTDTLTQLSENLKNRLRDL